MYMKMELEAAKAQANEEAKRHKEYVKQSFHLLKMTVQERDEARDQLQKLLNKLMTMSSSKTPNPEFLTTVPLIPLPESPMIKPTRANSSITESNSLSEPYNYQSQNSSPVESFLEAVSSPELSNINNHIVESSHNNLVFVNQSFGHDFVGLSATNHAKKFDQVDMILDELVKGKALPQRGNFLQAVLEAGPLLQTLIVAGPLPRWRNPPPLQTLHIPPVSIKGCGGDENVGQKVQPFVEVSYGTSVSTPMLNFGNGNLNSSGEFGNKFVPNAKRQRFY